MKERKYRRKIEGKKIKNMFKVNRLFLDVSSNSFNLFLSIIKRLNDLKIHKLLINFNYFVFFIIKLNIRK